MNLKSRLTLEDQAYRALVAKRDKLQAALHVDLLRRCIHDPQTNRQTHREEETTTQEPAILSSRRWKPLVHRASRAEDAYVLSTRPELARFKEDGVPKQRFTSELGQIRAQLEAAGDKQLAVLIAETTEQQVKLETRYPHVFESVDARRRKAQCAIRKSLNDDPDFQARNRAVVDAGKSIKAYEEQAAPNLDPACRLRPRLTPTSLKSAGAEMRLRYHTAFLCINCIRWWLTYASGPSCGRFRSGVCTVVIVAAIR